MKNLAKVTVMASFLTMSACVAHNSRAGTSSVQVASPGCPDLTGTYLGKIHVVDAAGDRFVDLKLTIDQKNCDKLSFEQSIYPKTPKYDLIVDGKEYAFPPKAKEGYEYKATWKDNSLRMTFWTNESASEGNVAVLSFSLDNNKNLVQTYYTGGIKMDSITMERQNEE